MAQRIASDRSRALIGMGVTGQSVARFWQRSGVDFDWYDTRTTPPGLEDIAADFPGVNLITGQSDEWQLDGYAQLVVSPGLSVRMPAIAAAGEAGAQICGDIELFARAAEAPVVAITGSNGKSTVTRMVGDMVQGAGYRVGVGGNLAPPALDLLNEGCELYVLELSSFQLEATDTLQAEVACILNVSQDHLDRYASILEYHAAKQRIYRGADKLVCNRDDALTQPLAQADQGVTSFGLDAPDLRQYGVLHLDGRDWLAHGRDLLFPCDQLSLVGRHNWSNALAAMAIAEALEIPFKFVSEALTQFRPLPHRCVRVADRGGVQWVDDSKATNVGACIAAISGLAGNRNIVLIAGGQGKGQDFEPLARAMENRMHALILIGEDARRIADVAPRDVQPIFAMSMQAAVEVAADMARPGDIVLLSPACASLDMFESYRARGEAFCAAVEHLR